MSNPINPPELFLADLASHVYGQTGQPRVLHVWSLSEARLSAQGKAQSDIVSPLGPVATGSNGEFPIAGWFIMESPIKMNDLEVPPFEETPILEIWLFCS